MKYAMRFFIIASMLAMVIGFSLPVSAAAIVTEELFPNPPSQLLNLGGDTELIWWSVTFDTTPVWMIHIIQDPHGTIIDTHQYNITGLSSPVYNPEDPTGVHQGDGNAAFAHHWDVPAGAEPGTYTSRVEYFSTTSLNGNPPNTDPQTGNWAQQAAQRFDVVQPLAIMKYHDLDGNGNNNSGTDPGLPNWHFDVSGPGWTYNGSVAPGLPAPTTTVFSVKDITPQFPLSGTHLFVQHQPNPAVDVGAYTLSSVDTIHNTGTITLAVAMTPAPSVGDTVSTSFTTYSGDTDSGGLIVLPNLQVGGNYTVTETMQSGWTNTDPPGAAPVQKIIHVPGDINVEGQIDPTNPIVFFGNLQLTPGTMLNMTANPQSLSAAGTTTLTVHESNTGNVALHNVSVAVTSNAAAPYNSFTLTAAGPNPAGTIFSGDTSNPGILDPLEIWTWVIPNVPVTAATTHFAAAGDGLDPGNNHVSPTSDPPFPGEAATADVSITPPHVPASSNPGLWLLIALFAGLVSFFVYRRTTRVRS